MNSEGLTQSFTDLPRVWRELGRTRQLVAGGVAAAVVLGIVAAALYFQRPQQTALYTNLNDQDAAAIVAKLKDLKVPYTVSDGGSVIRVPQEAAGELRLQLAGQGLPSGSGVGMVGMEVFDRTSFTTTDFTQRLNFQRGLEGELTRTIGRLSPVESARVHLVLPEQRLFRDQQRDTSASVVIKLKPGMKLNDDQVSSIKFLVSKGVEGLQPENVAVVDVNGNTLGKLESAEMAGNRQAAQRLDIQRQRETDLESKIQGMLGPVLGASKAVVRASVSLDWDEIKRDNTTVLPGQVISQQTNREQFSGTGAEAAAAGGVPGTQANIPTYQALPGGGNSQFNSQKDTQNTQPSINRENVSKAPGEVRNISVAVMVDSSVQAAQVDQITQVVTAAAGIQAARGDQVSVVSLPFDNSLNQQLTKSQEEQRLMDYIAIGMRVAGILIGLGGLFLLFRYLSNAVKPREAAPVLAAEPLALPGGTAGLLPASVVQQQLSESMTPALPTAELEARLRASLEPKVREELEPEIRQQVMAELEQQRRVEAEREQFVQLSTKRNEMRDSVTKLALEKPETLAEVLNSWLEQYPPQQQQRPARAARAG